TEALTWLVDVHGLAGHTERALAVALERRFVDLGADGVAFPSIVASGPNGAVPHHDPGSRVVQQGDLVTLDCGALVDGHHADCTRTFAVGKPDPVLVEVYEVVARAQAAGRAAVRAGVCAGDVDRAARQVAREAGHLEHYVHPTGHGVGLEIHEAPAVAPGSTATIDVGAVLTVEPGIYLPGIGGVRIEDTLVVDVHGAGRVLTDLPHELRVV
ncbi:MAG: M24 family metallopeptidase, partial [Nitriliruptoraceae bacterium]